MRAKNSKSNEAFVFAGRGARRIDKLIKISAVAFLFLMIAMPKTPAQRLSGGGDLVAPSTDTKNEPGDDTSSINGGVGTWSATGSLAHARYGHTATLLPSGKVLVAGGISNFANSASAELYDPATGLWSATGGLLAPRRDHTAALLANGKVLIAGGTGGSNSSNLSTAELYDPATGTWAATGSFANARVSHTMTLLANGKVLIAGGEGTLNGLSSAQVYDPEGGTWSGTGNLTLSRTGHTATLLQNGKVLVGGGYNGGAGGYLASAELYDPASGIWTATGGLVNARAERHTATLLPDGRVLVAGGANNTGTLGSTELYDPVSGNWSLTGNLTVRRNRSAAVLLPTGRVLIAGGLTSSTGTTSSELYDPASGTWSTTGSLSPARYSHTLIVLPNGKVLSAGGSNNGGAPLFMANADLYDTGSITAPPFGNISTRLRVLTGDNALIGGMIAKGTANKKVIIRAIGPTLDDFGVPGALQDPTLELYQGGTLLTSNDDWRQSAQQTEIQNSGLAPNKDAESAIIATLTPNQNYTAIVRGNNGSTGVGVVEAFDLDQGAASKLGNISTRGFVDVDDNVMIAGLIVSPSTGPSTRVLVRALGPTLGDFGVPGYLANPTLDLVNSSGTVIRSNDNWTSDQRPEIEVANLAPRHEEEAALVQMVTPGAYTAIVRGSGRTTGVALVEAYNLE